MKTTVATLLFSLLAMSCAAQETAPTVPQQAPPTGSQQDTISNYIIGPGDSIQVFVWRNPELSVTVPVRPDGKISTPLVEDMVAVGKKPSDLSRDIEVRLAEFIRSPQVNVIIMDARSSFSQVTVIGQVKTPQTVPYQEGMKVLDLVLAVGGLTEFAAGNRAKLVRKDGNGKDVEIKIRLNDLLTAGKLKENLLVLPGDVLIVPASIF
jgi:polysaccharide export outer membrane protein